MFCGAFFFFFAQLVIRFLSRLLLCRCRLVEGELPALVRLFVELSEGSGLCWCTVLICSNTTVLLSLSLWRSAIAKLSSQTMGIETLS